MDYGITTRVRGTSTTNSLTGVYVGGHITLRTSNRVCSSAIDGVERRGAVCGLSEVAGGYADVIDLYEAPYYLALRVHD